MSDFKIVYTGSAESAAKYSALEAHFKETLRKGGTLNGQSWSGGNGKGRGGYQQRYTGTSQNSWKRGNGRRGGHPYWKGRRDHGKSREPPKLDAFVYKGAAMLGDSIMVRAVKTTQATKERSKLCRGGMLSSELLKDIQACEGFKPKKACISIGGNDVMKGIEEQLIRENTKQVVKVLKERGCEEIKLLSIPPIATDQFGDKSTMNSKIERLNDLLAEMVIDEEGVAIKNTNQIFFDEKKKLKTDLFEKFYYDGREDLVHPNKKGLEMIVNALEL